MPEEAAMNTLDMLTKEKANKIHLAEMHQVARNRHRVRALESTKTLTIPKGRIRFALMIVVLILLQGALQSLQFSSY
jgi:hypothetical protein